MTWCLRGFARGQVVELKGPLKVFASSITATDSETQTTQKLYSYLAKYVEFNGKLGEVVLPFPHFSFPVYTHSGPVHSGSVLLGTLRSTLQRFDTFVLVLVVSNSRLRLQRMRRQP